MRKQKTRAPSAELTEFIPDPSQDYTLVIEQQMTVAMIREAAERLPEAQRQVIALRFGAGLTVCAHLVRWGERVTPLGESDAALPPVKKSALEMIQGIRSGKTNVKERSGAGLRNLNFIEQIYAD